MAQQNEKGYRRSGSLPRPGSEGNSPGPDSVYTYMNNAGIAPRGTTQGLPVWMEMAGQFDVPGMEAEGMTPDEFCLNATRVRFCATASKLGISLEWLHRFSEVPLFIPE
jgi:hypothetical protein